LLCIPYPGVIARIELAAHEAQRHHRKHDGRHHTCANAGQMASSLLTRHRGLRLHEDMMSRSTRQAVSIRAEAMLHVTL
jgi:hypothetical protein